MKIIDKKLINGQNFVAYSSRYGTLYMHRIFVSVSRNMMLFGDIPVSDTNLLEYAIIIYQFRDAINSENTEMAENLVTSLEPFRDEIDKKIEYALNLRYNLQDEVRGKVYTRKIERIDGGRIVTINGIKFPIIHSPLNDYELCEQMWGMFLKYMAEPYLPKIKSAKN